MVILQHGNELFQHFLEHSQNPQDSDFLISHSSLKEFVVYFRELSPLVSYEHSKILLEFLDNKLVNSHGIKEKRNFVIILRLLIENVPIMTAKRTRDLIKCNEMIERCSQYWNSGDRDIASNLTFCLFQTILFELNYLLGVSSEKTQKQLIQDSLSIWTNLIKQINVQYFDQCAFLQICTVLLLAFTSDFDKSQAETIKQSCKIIFKRIRSNALIELCTKSIKKDSAAENQITEELFEIDESQSILCTYNSALFALIFRNISSLLAICHYKLHFQLIDFIVSYSQKTNSLQHTLFCLSKNSTIRFGKCRQSIEESLLKLLPSQFLRNGKLNWAKLAKERQRKRKLPKDDLQSDWNSLLSIFEKFNDNEIETHPNYEFLFRNLSRRTINQIIASVPFKQLSNASPNTVRSSLRLLYLLASQQHKVDLPFSVEMINLMEAEPEPKIFSLQIGEKLLKFNARQPELLPDLKDLSALCLSMFNSLTQLNTKNIAETIKRKYLLAELSFLRTLLISMPILLDVLSPIITQLLPEFFIQSSNYRRQQALNNSEVFSPRDILFLIENIFPDKLEHLLSCVCRELVKNREKFHHLLSFAVASSLVDERRIRYPNYLIMTAMDEKDIALLSTNLPAWEKRKFAALHSQFFECNKIIG